MKCRVRVTQTEADLFGQDVDSGNPDTVVFHAGDVCEVVATSEFDCVRLAVPHTLDAWWLTLDKVEILED